MPDDWDDRIRSSTDYLNRRSDQIDFATTQAANRDAVYEGIITGDDFKERLALGISTDIPEESFAEHLESLASALESSSLPDAMRWISRLKGLEREPGAQRVLHEFATTYDQFYQMARCAGGIGLETEKDRIVNDVHALWKMVDGQ